MSNSPHLLSTCRQPGRAWRALVRGDEAEAARTACTASTAPDQPVDEVRAVAVAGVAAEPGAAAQAAGTGRGMTEGAAGRAGQAA